MKTQNNDQYQPEHEQFVLECAEELRRLAVALVKNLRQGNALPSLSSLAAMKPLQSTIIKQLTSLLNENRDENDKHSHEKLEDQPVTREKQQPHPGYL
jgi:hypothetical protein